MMEDESLMEQCSDKDIQAHRKTYEEKSRNAKKDKNLGYLINDNASVKLGVRNDTNYKGGENDGHDSDL